MNRKYIASVSWGKDSLAMLLMLIEKEYPIDEVVFCDMGVEFKAIYDTRDKTLPLLQSCGIKYSEINPDTSFMYDMLKRPVKRRGTNKTHKYGYSWCGLGGCRWGTRAKLKALDNYCKDAIVYVGIAADEIKRIFKERADNKRLPLVEWDVIEGEALLYCYQHGYEWMENGKPLYALLDRASCWCCGMKNLKELRNYKVYLPEYWSKLKSLQNMTSCPMKGKGKSVHDLDERFAAELKRQRTVKK